MVISVLGGLIGESLDDTRFQKRVKAEADLIGRKNVGDYRRELLENAQKDDFFTTVLDNNNSVVFPKNRKFGTNTLDTMTRINEVLGRLDTQEKIDQFNAQAEQIGGYGNNAYDTLVRWRNTNSRDYFDNNGNKQPAIVPPSVVEGHPDYDNRQQLMLKIKGYNEEELRNDSPVKFSIAVNDDDTKNVTVIDENTQGLVTEDYLVTNQQLLHPRSNLRSTFKNGNHVLTNPNASQTAIDQLNVFDMFNREPTTSSGKEKILRDWNSFYNVKAVQDNPETQINEGQGLPVEIFVARESSTGELEYTLETVYLPTEYRTNALRANIYPGMNRTLFTPSGIKMPDDKEYNNNPNSPYGDLASINDARIQAENQIFTALEIFNDAFATGLDPMSAVGGAFTFLQDAFLAEDSQLKQLLTGITQLAGDTLKVQGSNLSDDNRQQIEDARDAILEFMDGNAKSRVFGRTASQRVVLEQIFTLLAYNVALTTQGGTSLSARISDADFNNSKRAIVGGSFDSLGNRIRALTRYYQEQVPNIASFSFLDSEEGIGITPKARRLRRDILPIVLNQPIFEDQAFQDRLFNPYGAVNYLQTLPDAAKKIKIWTNSINYAYKADVAKAFSKTYNPNRQEDGDRT